MKTDHQAPARGFTIIEMLVVLAIITLLLGVVLSSQSIFNRTLLLTDTAYTVALSVRQTQSLGLSGRENSGLTNVGYGIHLASNGSNPITSFTQFADINPLSPGNSNSGLCPNHSVNTGPEAHPGNCLYDSASESIQQFNFSQGFTIGKFCGYLSGYPYCSNSGTMISSLDIVFEHPNTQTVMTGTLPNNAGYVPINFDTTCIQVNAPASNGSVRYIRVTQLGEITVTTSCP